MTKTAPLSAELTTNLTKITETYQLILQKLLAKQAANNNAMIDPMKITDVLGQVWSKLLESPEQVFEYQRQYTQNSLELFDNIMTRFMGQNKEPLYKPQEKDHRFCDQAWQQNAYFDFLKQAYLMTSEWLQHIVNNIQDIDKHTALKANFCIKQLIDAMAPTNFALTNPQVLREFIDSNGANLVKGMDKLLKDIERSNKLIHIETTDPNAFEIGVNIATSKGKVIFQNDLMQLIHYEPLTKKVHSVPLLIMPACINKYYILDSKEQNSFVKWLLENNQDVLMISWVNPDKGLADKDFVDYMQEGPLAAIDAALQATGAAEVNIIGYCMGGTLLSVTLAYLRAKGDNRVKSATFLTTLVDFANAGDLSIFIDEKQLEVLDQHMGESGFFDGHDMNNTFSLLRANEMIWSCVINNYLLGKDPLPFDLLYWNADSMRIPAKMHSFYLRNMYLHNSLCKPGNLSLDGVNIDLGLIDLPCYLLSTKNDHIAPWQSTYKATQLFSGDLTFTLAASGHIAGIINPPAAGKYCYWANSKTPNSPVEWLSGAKEHQGSWWPNWLKWQKKFSGHLIVAKKPGAGKLKAIEDAPGSYVKVRF